MDFEFFDSPRELVLSMMILIVERALPTFVKAAMSNNLIVFLFFNQSLKKSFFDVSLVAFTD